MIRDVQALVIGGGPSGLSVAYALQGDTLVLEKEDTVGGLCRSIHVGGGVFDIGGHSFHTPFPQVYELVQELLGERMFSQQRSAWVYTHNTLIPYPFQRYYDRIPDPEVVQACEEGLRSAGGAEGAEDFETYILQKFGRGIAEHFMLPYNRKLWARDIKKISTEWTSERVAGPKGAKEKFDTQGGERKPLQPDTMVSYPQQGGYEEIYRAFLPHIPAVELNQTVIYIDPGNHLVTTRAGTQYRYQFLVSTIPLPILVRLIGGVDPNIVALSDRLDFMSLRVELLLAGKRLDTPVQRIYIADPAILPHKIALNHNSSDHLRAQPVHAIMAEVSLSDEKPVDVEQIAPQTIDLLVSLGVLDSPEDIIWRGHVDVHYAYPVYTHARPGIVQAIKDYLRPLDIYTVGRFGDWEYINSDKCVMKGLTLGRELRERYSEPVSLPVYERIDDPKRQS